MARRTAFDVTIDISDVEQVADNLASFDAAILGRVAITSVNRVAERADAESRQRMLQGINLTEAYLQERMRFEPATDPARPEAVVSAAFRQTVLGRYNPVVRTQPALLPSRSKGNPKHGIPAGEKWGGVAVEVVRGNQKVLRNGFLMPLKAGKVPGGNGMGVFTRENNDTVKHRLGPSVYQLFRHALSDEFLTKIADDLADDLGDAASEELMKVLR